MQGPLDGSLYAKVRKKESVDATANGLPTAIEPVVEHTTAPVDHALSVSSDSGNSTASIKTDRTDETAQQAVPVIQQPSQPLSPEEKQELEQLLSGLEAPMHRPEYQNCHVGGGGAGGGILHLVPAQVHVNGHNSIDRETDILDDDLPNSQEGNSVDSLGTLSSLEGRATPADLYYQSETVINGQGVPYLEASMHGKKTEPVTLLYGSSSSTQEILGNSEIPSSSYASHNGGICRSQSFGAMPNTEQKLMPKAPARTTSSRDAVQRGLNVWQQFGVPEEPVVDGVHFSPALQSHSLPEFPKAPSQNEIEQSIEALNLLMLDLDPAHLQVPKSYSAPSGEGTVITTQPSFSKTQARPSYQADTAIHSMIECSLPQEHTSPVQKASSTLQSQLTEPSFQVPCHPSVPEPTGLIHSSGPSPTVISLELKPLNTYPPSTASQVPDPQEASSHSAPIRSYSTSSPLPEEAEPESTNHSLEGLVAHRVAGKLTFFFLKN